MDPEAYAAARRSWLVRVAVLLGRPSDRARALVGRVLAEQGRRTRRQDDPDPAVLRALYRDVRADRRACQVEALPLASPPTRPAPDPGGDDGIAVRRRLAAAPDDVRDLAVLAHGTPLGVLGAAELVGVRARQRPRTAAAARAVLGAADDDGARRRLDVAAATIGLDPDELATPARIPARGTRRTGVAAAVALATAAAVAAVTLPLLLGPDAHHARPERTSAALGLPRTPRGDQLPSFFAARLPDAVARLHSVALVVAVERIDVCEPPDVVLGSTPATGARFRLGDTVTLTAARRSARPCPGYDDRAAAWDFLAFADGRRPAPPLAARVRVRVDGAPATTLTARTARAPRAWGDALRVVAAATRRVTLEGASYAVPTLVTRRTDHQPGTLELVVAPPSGDERGTVRVDLHRDAAGRLEAVDVHRPRP